MNTCDSNSALRCQPPAGCHDGDQRLRAFRTYSLEFGQVDVDLRPLPLESVLRAPQSGIFRSERGDVLTYSPKGAARHAAWVECFTCGMLLLSGATFLGDARVAMVFAAILIAGWLLMFVCDQFGSPADSFLLSRAGAVVRRAGLAGLSLRRRQYWPHEDVWAVQVIRGLWYDWEHPFQTVQVNLVLRDGVRVNLSHTPLLRDACSDAASIALFLDIPLLNEAAETTSSWVIAERRVTPDCFGPGSRRPFAEYLQGRLQFPAGRLEEVVAVLERCPYVSDEHLYGQEDYWAHPTEFEQLGQGDCEDRALWAWRQLVSLGYDARLMVGWWQTPETGLERHAWVLFFQLDEPYVLETVASSAEEMLVPWYQAGPQYAPEFSVDGKLRTARHHLGDFRSRGRAVAGSNVAAGYASYPRLGLSHRSTSPTGTPLRRA